MSEPTQAQIDEAARAIFVKRFGRDRSLWNCKEDAAAALTAAAQVGEDRAAQKIIEPIIKDAITTAVNLTIERCAQMADECAQIHSNPDLSGIAKSIAAAIRRLKDAP